MTARAVPRQRARAGSVVVRRRRLVAVLTVLAIGAGVVHLAQPAWYQRLWHRLAYADTIRVHAAQTKVPADLIAAVIRRESNFDASARSPQGAVGLMQLMPATAEWVASQPGGLGYPASRLAEPEVNIAFGSWYLRYLLDKYGDQTIALAAYNGGETNAAQWAAAARSAGHAFGPADIVFPETRAFVTSVQNWRGVYRHAYRRELGLS